MGLGEKMHLRWCNWPRWSCLQLLLGLRSPPLPSPPLCALSKDGTQGLV